MTPDAPDFFVLHGTHDTLVGVDQARRFVERLREDSKRTVVYAELPARPARLRRLPVDPVRAHRARHRPLPALALEPVPAGEQPEPDI